MALLARVCRKCRTARSMVDGTSCPECGEPSETTDLLVAYGEQGKQLTDAEDQLKEGSAA